MEPLSNYFVGRVRRLLRGGNLSLGAIGTSVIRRFSYDSLATQMPRHAEAAGIDWTLFWKSRRYRFNGNVALSQVSGEKSAILRLQRSSARYYQRPDREARTNGFFTDAGSAPMGNFDFGRDRRALFEAHPRNIFLVKLNYWLPV